MAALAVAAARPRFTPEHKLRMAEAAVMQLYVDSVDENKLVEDAIRGMLEELDPHSSYSTPEETKELNEPLQGNFSGIGITFNMNNDTLYVIQTVGGGPSERVGLLAGDRIVAVNDTVIAGVKMRNPDIMKRLRGPKGTDVDVKVLRYNGAKGDTVNFRITRDDIPINSVEAAYMADARTGYIRLTRFAADTPGEVSEAIRRLSGEGMEQLILDLTDNGGGYLNAAADMLGELMPAGKLAVYTEGLNSPRHDIHTRPSGRTPLFADGRLVVMTNQYSASASEITAGAVQDWDRGLIVGRRTFGKGLVQRPVPFPDGSMVRLTVAHYYTPSGRDIQKPYTPGQQKDYNKDIAERFNHGELMHADSIKHDDSLRVATLANGRTIYGGGGISPDRFVPLDTTMFTKYYRNVMAKGLINRTAIQYVDKHRKQLRKQYRDGDAFARDFRLPADALDELRKMAESENIAYDATQAEVSAPLLETVITALIGRDIWDNATYLKIINGKNDIYKEALRLINSPEYDRLLSGTGQ